VCIWQTRYRSLAAQTPSTPSVETDRGTVALFNFVLFCCRETVKDCILDKFAGPPDTGIFSPSVQNTLYLAERMILDKVDQVRNSNSHWTSLEFSFSASWLSFVVGRSLVRISARRPTILTESFRTFTQFPRQFWAVGIALGYGLDDRGSRVRFPAGAGNCSLHHRVQKGTGGHPASYSMGTGDSFLGIKRPGA
jgi:hypothetical protein